MEGVHAQRERQLQDFGQLVRVMLRNRGVDLG